jgi:hypothetical protein
LPGTNIINHYEHLKISAVIFLYHWAQFRLLFVSFICYLHWHVFVVMTSTLATVACLDLPWLALACLGLPWLALACLGLPWLALACLGLPWLAFGGSYKATF